MIRGNPHTHTHILFQGDHNLISPYPQSTIPLRGNFVVYYGASSHLLQYSLAESVCDPHLDHGESAVILFESEPL